MVSIFPGLVFSFLIIRLNRDTHDRNTAGLDDSFSTP